jgi:hypothetical protein
MIFRMSAVTVSAIAASIAALAAIVAAILSGWATYFTGRREELKWRREALLDVVATFIEASFSGAGNQARLARANNEDLRPYISRTIEVERVQVEALTRMRLVAPADVIRAATALRNLDYAIHAGILRDEPVMSDETWATLRLERRDAREQLLSSARQHLGTGVGSPIQPVQMLLESHKLAP